MADTWEQKTGRVSSQRKREGAPQRLGGNKKISSAQKWKLKKTGGDGSESGSQKMSSFLKLTELANKIIETGNMDIYQETYEMIKLKVHSAGIQ
ncbi:CD2 antigen cytoplasmic tail-binding protein 2 [Portunus trituberculatus]|uniref:CD2 antigen cytoplasmic tail-binding protein 2 n=1 Tax=Portunus trituberculatus TaxID=210409 RepID=A0A5B7HPE4_PORTR|nr:CD2 antigen cytoplasmic tail-binding protein 2 [Portunus trituberculatus]